MYKSALPVGTQPWSPEPLTQQESRQLEQWVASKVDRGKLDIFNELDKKFAVLLRRKAQRSRAQRSGRTTAAIVLQAAWRRKFRMATAKAFAVQCQVNEDQRQRRPNFTDDEAGFVTCPSRCQCVSMQVGVVRPCGYLLAFVKPKMTMNRR